MNRRLVVAIDGHDGAGKTTLAAALSTHMGCATVCPFSGEAGRSLLKAGENKNINELVKIGTAAIESAVSSVSGCTPVILDRGWMTVASFVPDAPDFFSKWKLWIPTVLCWADLKRGVVVIMRLSYKSNKEEML
jgi:hypothetical protein